MSNSLLMKAELEELAETAQMAAERVIETEVVYLLKQIGWIRSQIKQDVSISDKGGDKADIVLELDNKPVILVEVKKQGQSRDAENQVNRYCRLLRPSPKFALLTDGVRWVLYYVGKAGVIPIEEAAVPSETAAVAAILTAIASESFSAFIRSGAFQYLEIVEQGLQERSEESQKHLRQFFASTVKFLLMSNKKSGRSDILDTMPAQIERAYSTEQSESAQTIQNQFSPQKGNQQIECDPFQPPPLGHTTRITASFAGKAASNWNDLLRIAIKAVLETGQTKSDIQRIAGINIQEGNISDKGFSQIEGTNLSIQGQDAGHAWQNALNLAQTLGCKIEARFQWKDIDKAAHPGKSGMLRWQP